MPRWLLGALAGTLLLGPAAGVADAVTTRDLVELSRAGLGDDVLVALIESDGSVFRLAAADLMSLRDQGLSEKVLIAMLKTAKTVKPTGPRDSAATRPEPVTATPPAEAAAPPSTDEPQESRKEIVAERAPVVVHVHQTVTQKVEQPRANIETVYVPVAVPVFIGAPVRPEPPKPPAYWGYGGQPRRGSWGPPDSERTQTPPPAKSKGGG